MDSQIRIQVGYMATWNPETGEMKKFQEVFPETIHVNAAGDQRSLLEVRPKALGARSVKPSSDLSADLERLASIPGVRIMKDRTFIIDGELDASKIREAELTSFVRVLMDMALNGKVTDVLRGPALMLTRMDELTSQLPPLYIQRLEKELVASCQSQKALFAAAQICPAMPKEARRYAVKTVPVLIKRHFDHLQSSQSGKRLSAHREAAEEMLGLKLAEWQGLGSDPKALRDRVGVGIHDLQGLTRTKGSAFVEETLACVQRFRKHNAAVLQGLRVDGMSLDQFLELHYEGYLRGEIAGHQVMEFAWERRCADMMRHAGEPTKDTWWDPDRRNSTIHHLHEDRQHLEREEKRLRPRRTQGDYEAYDLTRLALLDNSYMMGAIWNDAQERSKSELLTTDTFYLQILRLYARYVRDEVRTEEAQSFMRALPKTASDQVRDLVDNDVSYHLGRREKAAERITKWYELCAQDKAIHSIHYRLSAVQEIKRTVKPTGQDWQHCPKEVMKHADVWSLNRKRDLAESALRKLAKRYQMNPAIKAANGEYMRKHRPAGVEATSVRYSKTHDERVKLYGATWRGNA